MLLFFVTIEAAKEKLLLLSVEVQTILNLTSSFSNVVSFRKVFPHKRRHLKKNHN